MTEDPITYHQESLPLKDLVAKRKLQIEKGHSVQAVTGINSGVDHRLDYLLILR